MKTIELINTFHNTSVRVSAKWGDTPREAWYYIQYYAEWRRDPSAVRALRRVDKALCGIAGCRCGVFRDK